MSDSHTLHSSLQVVNALGHYDTHAFKSAVENYIPLDPLIADESLTTPTGRLAMERLLDTGLPPENIRDALLSNCPTPESYYSLASAITSASFPACQSRPDLIVRAGDLATALIHTLPQATANVIHVRSIYHLSRLQTHAPETFSATVTKSVYALIEHTCSKKEAWIENGFLEPQADPTLTPAGMASLCDFKPALDRLAQRLSIDDLEDGYSHLVHEVAARSHGSTPMKNISSAFSYCYEHAMNQIPIHESPLSHQSTMNDAAVGLSL